MRGPGSANGRARGERKLEGAEKLLEKGRRGDWRLGDWRREIVEARENHERLAYIYHILKNRLVVSVSPRVQKLTDKKK